MICRNRLLFKFVDIEKYDDEFINLLYLNLLSKNGQSLKDIKKQTEDLCIIAIQNDINAIEYVDLYTINILLELKYPKFAPIDENQYRKKMYRYCSKFVIFYDKYDINLKYITYKLFLINWKNFSYNNIDKKQVLIWSIKFNYFDYFIEHINEIKNPNDLEEIYRTMYNKPNFINDNNCKLFDKYIKNNYLKR